MRFDAWLKIRDPQLYEGRFTAAAEKLKDLYPYFRGAAAGVAAGALGTAVAGPQVGLPLGWLTAKSVADRIDARRNPDFKEKMKKK